MPLNMNTIGMGNGSGSSGGSGGIGSCIYSNNEYKETIVTPDNPEFSLSPDFLVEPTENYWGNHGVYTDTYHYQRYTSFQFFINHELYVLMDFLNQSYGYNGFDVDDGEIYVQMIYYNENYDGSTESEYNWNNIIIDTTGNILLQTPALDIYDSDIYNTVYLIKNNNNKMVLLDKDFKEISNEYDKIITNSQIDISTEYSSY